MSVTEPLLSICIPTYSRANELENCLRRLVEQCREFGVEICISDNGSPDATSEVIARWQSKYHLIRSFRQAKNLKIDRNIVSAARLATGRYIWFFSDDDVLEDGAIREALALIGRHPEAPAFIVNRSEYDSRLESRVGYKRLLQMPEDAERALDVAVALEELAEYLGYLPAWMIRREEWNRVDTGPFLDTDFVHVGGGLLAVSLSPVPKIVVTNRPLVRCRLARASWRNRHYEIWIRNWQKVMTGLSPRVARGARDSATSQIVQSNLICLLSGRGTGGYDWVDFREHVSPYLPKAWQKSVAALLAFMPVGVARELTNVQRQVRERLRLTH